jgi:hypothetical protein
VRQYTIVLGTCSRGCLSFGGQDAEGETDLARDKIPPRTNPSDLLLLAYFLRFPEPSKSATNWGPSPQNTNLLEGYFRSKLLHLLSRNGEKRVSGE